MRRKMRSALGVPRCWYQCRVSQVTTMMKSMDGPPVSVSTALNQCVSEKATRNPPTRPPAYTANRFTPPFVNIRRKALITMKNAVEATSADVITDRKLVRAATSAKGITMMNRRQISRRRGFPGGCGLPSTCEAAMSSPQSQKDSVGAIVRKYAVKAAINTTPPRSQSSFLSFIMVGSLWSVARSVLRDPRGVAPLVSGRFRRLQAPGHGVEDAVHEAAAVFGRKLAGDFHRLVDAHLGRHVRLRHEFGDGHAEDDPVDH